MGEVASANYFATTFIYDCKNFITLARVNITMFGVRTSKIRNVKMKKKKLLKLFFAKNFYLTDELILDADILGPALSESA